MTLKLAQRLAAGLLLLGAGACAWIWNARRALPYNEEGRFLDAANAVVLHQQSVTIYGLLALALTLFAAICWQASRRG